MSRRRARPTRTPASGAAAAATEIADRLHSAAIHVLRRVRREDDAAGIAGPRGSALSVIVYNGPISLGALADAERVRPPTMTRLVAALEAQGLVRREAGREDRRVTLISATAAGVRLLEQGRERRVAALAVELGRLGRDELRTLSRALDSLEGVVGPPKRWRG